MTGITGLSVKAGWGIGEWNAGNDGNSGNDGNAGSQDGNAGSQGGMGGIRVGMQGIGVWKTEVRVREYFCNGLFTKTNL